MNFLPKKILAIDISDSSIEIMQASHFLGKMKVTFLSRSELGKGIVENGRILEKKQLALKIKEYCDTSKKNKIALALPDSIVSSRILKFPASEKISNEDILREAKKFLPINENDYWSFDSQDIEGEKIVLFVAARRKDIDDYKSIFEEINFIPEFFDLNSLCVLRGLDLQQDGIMVVDLGGRTTVMSVIDKGYVQAINSVRFGGENITERVSEKLNISQEEVDALKMNVGFDVDKEDGEVFLAFEEIFQPFIDEARKVMNSYEASTGKKIKKIILSGGTGIMPRLDEYVYENFGINCEIVRPRMGNLISDYLRKNKVRDGIDTIFFAATLGLAARFLDVKTNFNTSVNLLK